MRSLTFYFSKNSDETANQTDLLRELCDQYGLFFVEECITGDKLLEEKFSRKAPIVLIGPYHLNGNFTRSEVEIAIRSVIEKDESNYTSGELQKRFQVTYTEKFSYWFSKYYTWVISAFLFVYVGIAFLAPVFAHQRNVKGSDGIYRVYSVLCHQLGYRSFYLFGAQSYYPRELANIEGVKSYEEVTGRPSNDLDFARNMTGNETMGYKIALCQRDVAIYLSMALFGIFFQLTGKRIRSLKWYLWFIIALAPIAIDGFSQLPGLSQGWPIWFPQRESTPVIRVLTGFLFGAGTAWFMFPLMEESVKETRYQLKRKFSVIKKIGF